MTRQKRTKRRDFLKGIGIAATGVAAASAFSGCASEAKASDDEKDDGCEENAAILPTNWDRETEVIVVGTGFAGLTTALVAYDAGANVLIVEKMNQEQEGGNSKVSGNMWWAPTNVPEGIEYIKALSYGLTDDECIETLATEMSTLNQWLADTVGISAFGAFVFQPEYPELPGAGSVRTYSNLAGMLSGAALWNPLKQQVANRGIEILYETPAKKLVQDPSNGEIRGLIATSSGEDIFIKAKKAVVLACGGFEYDFEMQSQFLPGWPVYSQGSPGNTGDGIKMAQKAGAALWHMNNTLAHLGGIVVPDFDPVAIPASFPRNRYILVNKFGERFVDELRPNRHGFGHKEILLQFDGLRQTFPNLPCYCVFDETARLSGALGGGGIGMGWFGAHVGYRWSADNSVEIEKGWIKKGATVGELATAVGIDPAALEQTVSQYNEYCANGEDLAFKRSSLALIALGDPPFYAIPIYPIMYNTMGGPRRNKNCQIIDPFGEPIPRLYSAGELGSFWGWMYNGGGNNAECLCTGRITGRNTAAETPWDEE